MIHLQGDKESNVWIMRYAQVAGSKWEKLTTKEEGRKESSQGFGYGWSG